MSPNRYTNPPHLRAIRKSLRKRSTPAERRLWQILRARRLQGVKFRRQHGIGRYVVDFYCPAARLAVEVDGAVHDDPLRAEADRQRQAEIEALGIRVVRFSNDDVLRMPDLVAEALRQELSQLA
ncbi:MAG: endonuclease domain-containing protein [Bacteroidota bacterium]